jgi:hypothetical protein
VAISAAGHGQGSLERAALWCDASLLEFRGELLQTLFQPEIELQAVAKRIGQFVDEAGKESAAKRQRLRLVVSLAEEFYRAALLACETKQGSTDLELARAVASTLKWMPPEMPANCLDICLDAYAHIDANVNQAILIEWWLDELFASVQSNSLAGISH